MTALSLSGVVKHRGARTVLREVSLTVEPGERVALLGPNGAGKTTLIRAAIGVTAIDKGEIAVLGMSPGSAARRQVSYLPENVVFHGALTAREQLRHFARLKDAAEDTDALLERVGLGDAADRRLRTYSKGMRQRLGLAQVLLGPPRLALLDEPTSGLDPVSRHEFYRIVDEIAAAGTAVVLSSHALTELEARTDRIAILGAGKLVANDNIAALRARAGLPIRIGVAARDTAADTIADRIGGTRVNGSRVEFSTDAAGKMKLLAAIASLGDAVEDVEIRQPSLEDLYLHLSAGDEP